MSDALAFLAEPLHHAFLVRGLAAGMVVGVVCAIVGTFVVLRGMAFLGDAMAHTILPGVALGYLAGGGARGPVFWGGLGAALCAAMAIGFISRRARMREDAAIGVIFAGMFALGVALISSTGSYAVDLSHFLFGDVLGVSNDDLVRTAIVGAAVILVVAGLYKELLVVTFDPVFAATLRIPAGFLYYLLLVLVAAVIVISLQTVGVAMMVAMLVTPPAAARLLVRRVPAMMALAGAIGCFSTVFGLYVSYYAGLASGAAIVLTATLCFLLALAGTGVRGFLRRRAERRGG